MSADMKLYADYQRYNFFRRPEWRWDRVLGLCDRYPNPGRCTKRDDDFIRKARNFLLRRRDDPDKREQLWFEYPGLSYAYDMRQKSAESPEGAMFIEARLLAGQSYADIAASMSTLPDTVRWYEALYFNVLPHLRARDWITKAVLLPAILKYNGAFAAKDSSAALPFRDSVVARPFLDASLKLFAYFGGPQLVDVMLAGFQAGKPLSSQDNMANWFDQNWSMTLRRRSSQAALQFEINKYNVTELFAVHSRIIEVERSAENQDQVRSDTERHIKAMVDEIPWAFGADAKKSRAGTVLGRLEDMPGELRDEEMLKVASGETVPGLADNFPARLPPPRKKQAELLGLKNPEL
jgi:hypothetical protein